MSQGEYTISAVSTQTRDYGEGTKAKRVYYVKLNEAQPKEGVQAFELHKFQSSKPPEPGHKLDVKTFQEGEFQGVPFVKIIQNYDRAGSSGGGSSSGGGGDHNRDSIERQTAAKCAAEMAAAIGGGQMGGPQVQANFEELFNTVLTKIQGAPQAAPVGGEIPADGEGLPTNGGSAAERDAQIGF